MENKPKNEGDKIVYHLFHEYELDLEDGISDVTKTIGIFTNEEKANEVINYLITKDGFKDHPRDCFVISERSINKYGWKTGFITWGEQFEYFEELDSKDEKNG